MSKTFAVIIGVSNYTIPSVGQLPFCIKDIKEEKISFLNDIIRDVEHYRDTLE